VSTNQIISKVWSFCNTLGDDGVSYGDYLKQPTYQLLLEETITNYLQQSEAFRQSVLKIAFGGKL
jgi:hypothetical protein